MDLRCPRGFEGASTRHPANAWKRLQHPIVFLVAQWQADCVQRDKKSRSDQWWHRRDLSLPLRWASDKKSGRATRSRQQSAMVTGWKTDCLLLCDGQSEIFPLELAACCGFGGRRPATFDHRCIR